MGGGGLFSTLRGKSSRQAVLEQNLLEEYRKISASARNPPEPKRLLQQYLHTCHTLPYYGLVLVLVSFQIFFPIQVSSNVEVMTTRCAFFPGEIDKPAQGILHRGKLKAVSVCICLEGVYVMDVKEKVSLTWIFGL